MFPLQCNSAEVVSGHCSLVVEVGMMNLVMDRSEVHGLCVSTQLIMCMLVLVFH